MKDVTVTQFFGARAVLGSQERLGCLGGFTFLGSMREEKINTLMDACMTQLSGLARVF